MSQTLMWRRREQARGAGSGAAECGSRRQVGRRREHRPAASNISPRTRVDFWCFSRTSVKSASGGNCLRENALDPEVARHQSVHDRAEFAFVSRRSIDPPKDSDSPLRGERNGHRGLERVARAPRLRRQIPESRARAMRVRWMEHRPASRRQLPPAATGRHMKAGPGQ